MDHRLIWRAARGLFFAALVTIAPGNAQTVNLGTQNNAAQWLISGAGAVNATAFQLADTFNISPTSNADSTGTAVAGFIKANFNGFWRADETFTIPAGATNVSLAFSNLFADDRTVLELNGAIIGSAADAGGPLANGTGVMRLTETGTDQTYTFSPSLAAGTVTTGFNVGGTNTLSLIVNNTGTWYGGPTAPWQTTTDGSAAGVTATLSYTATTTSVPALSTGAMILLAGVLLFSALFAMRGLSAARNA